MEIEIDEISPDGTYNLVQRVPKHDPVQELPAPFYSAVREARAWGWTVRVSALEGGALRIDLNPLGRTNG